MSRRFVLALKAGKTRESCDIFECPQALGDAIGIGIDHPPENDLRVVESSVARPSVFV
jgi:hypothetical protein